MAWRHMLLLLLAVLATSTLATTPAAARRASATHPPPPAATAAPPPSTDGGASNDVLAAALFAATAFGDVAISAVSSKRMARIAAKHGRRSHELRHLLTRDGSLGVSPSDDLVYACNFEGGDAGDASELGFVGSGADSGGSSFGAELSISSLPGSAGDSAEPMGSVSSIDGNSSGGNSDNGTGGSGNSSSGNAGGRSAVSSVSLASTSSNSQVYADEADPAGSRAFLLHSCPGCSRTIHLDFDGCSITNSSWRAGGGAINTPPYDTDGSPSSFSAAELTAIIAIWRAVAEAYTVFDVDVTTEDPGSYRRLNYGMKVCFGGSPSDWYCPGSDFPCASGVAILHSFGKPAQYPVWVWAKSPQRAWETASHELGHTLGLTHDGVQGAGGRKLEEYYRGNNSWAPIMGASYGKQITHWTQGLDAYPGANNPQDDLAQISSILGYRPKDRGTDPTSGTRLCGGRSLAGSCAAPDAASLRAVVRSSLLPGSGSDTFSFAADAAGDVVATLSVVPAAFDAAFEGWFGRSKLFFDLQLSAGRAGRPGLAAAVLLAAAAPDPSKPGPVTLRAFLPASGTYYLTVTPSPSSDFTAYGCIGSYTLDVTWPALASNLSPPSPPSPPPPPSPPSPPPPPPPPRPPPPRPPPPPPRPPPPPPVVLVQNLTFAIGAATACPDDWLPLQPNLNGPSTSGLRVLACVQYAQLPSTWWASATSAQAVPGAPSFVSDVRVGFASGALSAVRCPMGYVKVDRDLNAGTPPSDSGQRISIATCLRMATNPSVSLPLKAITIVRGTAACPKGYSKVNGDLNAGTSGKPLYFCQALLAQAGGVNTSAAAAALQALPLPQPTGGV